MYFKGEFYFLSNMYPCKVIYNGINYGSSENLFQALKCANSCDMTKFVGIHPIQAKKLGRTIEMKKNWEKIKINRMRLALYSKFKYNPELVDKLLEVKEVIREDNNWNDTFWGVYHGCGKNVLGQLLMEIRDYYLNKQNSRLEVFL